MLPEPSSSGARTVSGTDDLRVIVVDDHATFSDLLALAFRHEPGVTCVGTATTVLAGRVLVDQLRPDVVIMDVQVGDEDGIEATAELVTTYPDLRVVVLTAHLDTAVVQRAAVAGACCVLPKNCSLMEVLHGLRVAEPGGLVVAPAVLKGLMSTPALPEQTRTRVPLSQREHEVLRFLGEGLDVHRIAAHLEISVTTCRGHVRHLLSKLGAHSQLEAVAIAKRQHVLVD